MTVEFKTLSPGQCRALGRIAKQKNAPPKLIVGWHTGPETSAHDDIIVVPASSRDRRRWNVSYGGKIMRTVR